MQRIHVLLAVLVLLLLGLVWTLKPTDEPEPPKATPLSNPLRPEEKETFKEETQAPRPPSTSTLPPANPSSLRNEEIAGVSYDGQRYILRLTDGRKVALWPSQIDQLSPEVKARILYRRGGGPRR